ncbi:flagellar assembly protein FliH [Acidovorax sp. sic0104]|uniref:FliH/SctL family protein n=1 Tax=Acidovorax sp. sic0104 TaxID=2854784 RepID=UPI001C4567F8|nr:flagellar assembly protein FliH [Acidovorax sp. sic0104]MBV7544139.1 flagellar assembly protein FliH [Acidovorax sp. sic0104]
MMTSPHHRSYSRFIPSEEVGDFTQWKFGAVDGSDLVEPEPAEPAAELPPEVDEAAQQALIQQACDDAYAEGFAQGQAETALEWQRRMDEYIAQQGAESAQRLQAALQTFEASLDDMQQQMAQQLLELACDIARQVVRQELSVNPNALQPVVREAVNMLVTEGRPAMVRLNPDDMEAMAQPLREEMDGPGVQWLADAAVAPGGCLVESAGTVVDGSLDKRWQRAIAALGLQSPWQQQEEGGDEQR